MIVRELFARLGIIADDAAVKRFDAGLSDIKQGMGEAVSIAGRFTVAIGAVGSALGLQAIATTQVAEAASNGATALGLTTDAYQEWATVFASTNVSAEEMGQVWGHIGERLHAAREEAGDARDDFAALGLKLDDLDGVSTEQALLRIADGLVGVTDAGERLRIAQALVGKNVATSLLPALLNGSAGIATMRAEAHRLGAVLDEDAIATAKSAAVAFTSFRLVLAGLRNEVGISVLPVVEQLTHVLTEFLADNRAEIGRRLRTAIEAIGNALDDLTRRFYTVSDAVDERFGGWASVARRVQTAIALLAAYRGWAILATTIGGLTKIFGALTAAGGLLAGASLATVLGWAAAIGAAFVALYLIIDDLWTYWRGGESVIGDFLAGSERGRVTLGALGDAAAAVGEVLMSMFGALRTFADILLPLLAPLLPMLQGMADGFAQVFGNQALASLRAFTAGMLFLAELIQFTTGSIADLVALVKGNAGLGEVLDRFGGRAGELVGAGGRMIGQGVLAIPGMGALTGGGKSASQGGVYVPATSPTSYTPAPAPSSPSVGGDTINVYGMSSREMEELQYRQGQKKGRALAALGGTT